MEARDQLFDQVEQVLWTSFQDQPDEAAVRQLAEKMTSVYLDTMGMYPELRQTLDRDAFIESLVTKYSKEKSIKGYVGTYLVDSDENTPWLREIKDEVDWHYWKQYDKYLRDMKHWSGEVVSSIEQDSFEILALTGNPNDDSNFKKKGLVVGNVQSGKTANYLGLICRAADVGYKYIVVLAAITNDLRAQTQQRVEEGFIGIDCNFSGGGKVRMPQPVGVGEMAHGTFRHPNPGTSRDQDFSKGAMQVLLRIGADNVKEPWVFIVKKNANTLRNLILWFKTNVHEEDQLFLVDDEADNASINTKYSKDEISKINAQIRELLSLFGKSVYVGYTATPYANILVDKNEIDEKYGKDLFPRNFIYTLSAADSYFGATEVFGDIEQDEESGRVRPRFIRYIGDIALMPPNAKTINIQAPPESLKDAIMTFLLASVLRVKRLNKNTHASMLVNTSPYNAVQKKLKAKVDEYLTDSLIPDLKVYGAKDYTEAEKSSPEIRRLHEIWLDEFEGKVEFKWSEVYSELYPAICNIRTVLVNSKSKDGLRYNDQIEHVIAFGGYKLSRGLTLEGLLVSYFSRNSKAYDTLMQMSRWFGHRTGYEDLCRIWMTAESAGWCKFVADATDDLMSDFIRMQQLGRTPLEFGHKIKAHPNTLMVTARNKMGAGRVEENISLGERIIETTAINPSTASRKQNQDAVNALEADLQLNGKKGLRWGGPGGVGILYSNVPSRVVERFISSYDNCEKSPITDTDRIMEWIGFCSEEGVDRWDVMFAGADEKNAESEEKIKRGGFTLYKQRRTPGENSKEDFILIGNNNKVSTKRIDYIGLPEESIKEAREEFGGQGDGAKRSLDRFLREKRKRPLLLIHELDVRFPGETEFEESQIDKTVVWNYADKSLQLTAYSIIFPKLRIDRHVKYVLNPVALEELGYGGDVADEDSGDEDDSL